MSRAGDLFQPNRMKLLLALTFLVPVFFLVVLAGGFLYQDKTFPLVITTIVSYLAACLVDDGIQSRSVKIFIASVSAIISILAAYLLTRSMTMVCDPVHDPGNIVCDPVHIPEPATTAPTVIATVQPPATTPMIFDPVHEPNGCGQACRDALDHAAGTSGVAQKLDECLQNCLR